jgi:pimeloyl-ACP methyl ester carboxylesterase
MRTDNGGVGIEYQVTGEGKPVILLHGFPDSSRLWRNQVPVLADAGFQVITPDLRGYGKSDKPEGVDPYHLLMLASDVTAVLDDVGVATAHVVGHDWGAALAWVVATFLPDRVDHLAAMSVGHPAAFAGVDGFEQREKSWYMLLFQFEGVAERWFAEHGQEWSNHPDFDAVWADLQRDGSLTPGLNWYRANVPPESYVTPPMEFPPVTVPTMGIWSSGDFALTEAQMRNSAGQCSGGFRYERIDGPGHWMQLEAPDRVNALLVDFLPT